MLLHMSSELFSEVYGGNLRPEEVPVESGIKHPNNIKDSWRRILHTLWMDF